LSASATIHGKEVFELLREDLVALEQEFEHDTVSGVQAITEIGEYLRAGGGKRIRPALLLLSAVIAPRLCPVDLRSDIFDGAQLRSDNGS